MGLYLYAIVGESHLETMKEKVDQLAIKAIDGQPIEFLVVSGLAIAYSEAKQERYLASRANLLTHETVIEHLMHALEPEKWFLYHCNLDWW